VKVYAGADQPIAANRAKKKQLDMKKMNVEKLAKAIELDAGMPLPDLRQALNEAKVGLGSVTKAEQILVRHACTNAGLSQQAFADRIVTPFAMLHD
jgi:putative transcriptional regulator